ncbi:hypothetical protein G6F68_018147 [Rhizopus microsporus]|nr:hypothetical protein G6F68_018147 [Rhizopus microsporus]
MRAPRRGIGALLASRSGSWSTSFARYLATAPRGRQSASSEDRLRAGCRAPPTTGPQKACFSNEEWPNPAAVPTLAAVIHWNPIAP